MGIQEKWYDLLGNEWGYNEQSTKSIIISWIIPDFRGFDETK